MIYLREIPEEKFILNVARFHRHWIKQISN